MLKPKYYISSENEFVIENYNSAPTFSSFFPGVAGTFGCPMWVFYANRGQCITSAGFLDKDDALMEFQAANKAYRDVALNGFRTFLKIDGAYYEPFSERSDSPKEMRISSHGLTLVEENKKLKVRVEVNLFTVPNETFPGLARVVKVTNLGRRARQVELIDGLPIIIPFGFANDFLKRLSQTIEAWCQVENLERHAPFFRLKVLPADVSETRLIEKGHFFLSFAQQGNKQRQVDLVIDPTLIFGEISSLEFPDGFAVSNRFKLPRKQLTQGFIPCAFAHKKFRLGARSTFELYSLFGQADNVHLLNQLKRRVSSRKYFARKALGNRTLVDQVCAAFHMESASKSFDLYSRQTFLDNVLRGGLPVTVGNKVVYTYYRKHGDMERDYNDFRLMPTYFSQGNGNYRDINQNRRDDVFVNPDVGDDNIIRFFNLIQLDGFNPLVVLGSQYCLKSARQAEALVAKHFKTPDLALVTKLTAPFLLGELIKENEETGAEYKISREEFARELVALAVVEEGAVHGEGFWIDHFFYNLDLLESFECLFPEQLRELLINKPVFTYFDNEHVVVDRKDRYRLVGGKVRQYESVRHDVEKSHLLNSRGRQRHLVRTGLGKGEPYYTTLAGKLLCLAVNKAASFDAEGIGLEMEADKPGWYDALNGLPALFGSSLSEALELKRLALYTLKHLRSDDFIVLPVEVAEFLEGVNNNLLAFFNSHDNFQYWDVTAGLKETFRRRVRLGLSGEEVRLTGGQAGEFLKNIVKKCDAGIRRCLDKYGNYHTYFINEAVEFETQSGNTIKVRRFAQSALPLFLEGFVHALKVEQDKRIYQLVKQSPLYDRELKMYKVNSPLETAPIEVGRARIFTPGWLENESIWLHMEYKYLLELLKAGLYDEFFRDFKHALVPFMDPKKYKRSTLENSSFIVSSAHPNKHSHGRGFVARLSGGAIEFMDMWLIMTTGKKIFSLDGAGKLVFNLSPLLPGWLFKKGKLVFTLLGSIEVTYLNKKGRNTYGQKQSVKPRSYRLCYEDREVEINAPVVPEPHARAIRDRKVKKIVVNLG